MKAAAPAAHRPSSREVGCESSMLQQLIDPFPLEKFWSEHFEKQPLYVARPRPAWCRDMPTIDDLDAILSYTANPESRSQDYLTRVDEHGRDICEVKRGPDGRPDMAAFYRGYATGWSMCVFAVHERWAPVARMASAIISEVGHRVNVNLYCTPSGARGFAAHADSHDVFVLQLTGRKSWRVFAPQYVSPLEAQVTNIRRSKDQLGAPVLEVTTGPGEVLYLPRGYVHEAQETAVPSMHLAIGILPLRWLDLLEAGLHVVAERDERFRRTAPSLDCHEESRINEVAREFSTLLRAVQGTDVVLEAMQRCDGARSREFKTSPDPHFNTLEQSRALTGSTEVEKRSGFHVSITHEDQRAQIEFGTRTVNAPVSVAPALEFIRAHDRFRVADLPDVLSDASKIVLVRRLIHEGLLKIAAAETD
jgi:ribosomal protein L16 Arg81 hydroxylase